FLLLRPPTSTLFPYTTLFRSLDDLFLGRIRTRYATLEAIEQEVFAADVVIGAVLVPGASAPKLVSRAQLAGLKRRAVLVDVAIEDRKSTRLNSSHVSISYAVF